MSADRSRVYELALTPLEILKARGASQKEIDIYLQKRDKALLGPSKKK